MSGVGGLYLLMFPLIMMVSISGISVQIALSMGGLRRTLGWELALLNLVSSVVVCASQWGGLWLLGRLFGSDGPVFLSGLPRLATLMRAGTLVLGGLGLWMGLCMQRWGGKAMAVCALVEALLVGGCIAWMGFSYLRGGVVVDLIKWFLVEKASLQSCAVVVAGCVAVAALLHLCASVLLKKAVVKI